MQSTHPRTVTLIAAAILAAAGAAIASEPQSAPEPGAAAPPTITLAAAQDVQPRQRRRPPPITAPVAAPKLTVARVDHLPADTSPDDPLWQQASPLEVNLQPQQVVSPMLDEATLETAQVWALTDGSRIAWRFSWSAPNPATSTETGLFSDAVGIQFPLAPDTTYLMGAPGLPVHSFYWRAQWNVDIAEGFQDVRTLYPNAWNDIYWFADDRDFQVPGSFQDERGHQWFVGLAAGNPMSIITRSTPVEEITAEGVGTVTHIPGGIATGRGTWRDGYWHVVIIRPIVNDPVSQLFAPGNSSEFAVAVWDGHAGNVAGRKHHTLWVDFEVQP